jgi:hypothetical protein
MIAFGYWLLSSPGVSSTILAAVLLVFSDSPVFAQQSAPTLHTSVMQPSTAPPDSSQEQGPLQSRTMAQSNWAPVNTGPGIVFTCNPNVNTTHASACNYLNTTVAGYYNDTFTNANANIYVQFGSTGLGQSQFYYNFVTYSQYATAYTSIANKSAIQVSAQSALSTYDATPYGSDYVWIQPGIARALGISAEVQGGCVGCNLPLLGIKPNGNSVTYCTAGTAGCYDGIITVTNSNQITLYYDDDGGSEPAGAYDFYAVVQHETDEVLGTPSCISTSNPLKDGCDNGSGGHGTPSAVDLFRYSSAGNLVLDSSLSTTPGAYFSYNGGTTDGAVGVGGSPKYYNTGANGADYADYAYSSPCAPNEAIQDAYACPGADGGLTILNDGGSEVNILTAAGYEVPPAPGSLQFVTVTPCRIADTRGATGAFGGPELAGGSTRTFNIPQSACSIPATAVAYSLNATVVPNGSLNYLTLWPAGQAQPNVSTLNSDGRTKANATITPAGINGGVSVYVTDATQFILDIDGYFVPVGNPSGLEFFPLTPCRIADTRNAAGPLGGPSMTGGTSRDFPILSSSCGIPGTAQAYSLNVTAVPHGPLGWLTAWPSGQGQPTVSTLNASTGAVTANAAIVPAGTGGNVSIFVSNSSDVILDVNGYFAPSASGGLSLYTVAPCRVIDTRSSSGAFNGTLVVPVQGSVCAPPSAAQAYVLNATVVPPGFLNYLTLWPDGAPQPNVSTLNSYDGAITSNMAIVPNTNGSVDAFSSNSTQLIFDISGYFAP